MRELYRGPVPMDLELPAYEEWVVFMVTLQGNASVKKRLEEITRVQARNEEEAVRLGAERQPSQADGKRLVALRTLQSEGVKVDVEYTARIVLCE